MITSEVQPPLESLAIDYTAELEREAARLRRFHRLHKRIMNGFMVVALLIVAGRGLQTIQFVRPEPPPSPPINATTLNDPTSGSSSKAADASLSHSKPVETKDEAVVSSPHPIDNDVVNPPTLRVDWGEISTSFPWDVLLGLGVVASVVILGIRRVTAVQMRAGSSLCKFDDIRAIGPLIEVLRVEDVRARNLARNALQALLPRLQASDAALLGDEHHQLLHKELKIHDDRWSLAIIKSLEQVGDGRDVTVMERIVKGEAGYYRTNEVRLAATECLGFLSERGEEHRLRSTLLRASGLEQGEESLLRPAAYTATCDPAHLLRPTEPS